MEPKISVIAAIGKNNRAICEGQNLLWVIPADHKRLRDKTMGHTLIMGRKTYDSIGKPLPGRLSVVMTTNKEYVPAGMESGLVKIAYSSDEALQIARESELHNNPGKPEVFIFGGGEIYKQTLNSADKLYLTVVDSEKDGTAHFPEYKSDFTKVTFSEERTDIEKNTGEPIKFQWLDLERE